MTNQNPINMFKGTFLSNMHPCIIYFQGIRYECTESAYQAHKTDDIALRKQFANRNGYEAKKLGRLLRLRADWDEIKLILMEELLVRKFTPGSPLANQLLGTGDAKLTEGNYWHDNFWGSCTCQACRMRPKENHLGKLLMKIRDKLQNDKQT